MFSINEVISKPWPEQMRHLIRNSYDLCTLVDIDPSVFTDPFIAKFPILVSHSYINRIRPGDVRDPLLLQVLAQNQEALLVEGFVDDPTGEHVLAKDEGLIQKYKGRVLITTTGACAIHCRYCFRREFPYKTGQRNNNEWANIHAQVTQDPSIHEVILSGGDPLVFTNNSLRSLITGLLSVPHVQTIRIHTRLPSALPARIDIGLLALLKEAQELKNIVLVTHINHANELRFDCSDVLRSLKRTGITLLNQSVLLLGINDNLATLKELSSTLFEHGVLPYYLHQLDRIRGAHHFEVDPDWGLQLVAQLKAELPGYLVPRYVREVAGAKSKIEVIGAFQSH